MLCGDLDESLRDQRACDRGAEEVLAFVDRVGAEHREDEVAHELLADVLNVDVLDGDTHLKRLGPSGFDLFSLPKVGGEGDDLCVVGLLQPTQDDGGVETTAVGEYNLHDSDASLRVRGVGLVETGEGSETFGEGGATDVFSGYHDQGVITGDGTEDLGHPRPVKGGADHVGRARWRPEYDEVERVVDISNPIRHHPTQMVLGRNAVDRMLRDRIDSLTSWTPNLDRTQIIEIARHGRLCGVEAFGLEQFGEPGLRRHRMLLEEGRDAVLAACLAHGIATMSASLLHQPRHRTASGVHPVGGL